MMECIIQIILFKCQHSYPPILLLQEKKSFGRLEQNLILALKHKGETVNTMGFQTIQMVYLEY